MKLKARYLAITVLVIIVVFIFKKKSDWKRWGSCPDEVQIGQSDKAVMEHCGAPHKVLDDKNEYVDYFERAKKWHGETEKVFIYTYFLDVNLSIFSFDKSGKLIEKWRESSP